MTNIMNKSDKIGILDIEGINPNPLNEEPYSDTYKDLAKIWSSFPAYKKIDDVLNSIKNNQLTFIISGTGSGKTVLIPKIALHYTNYQGKIGVTLPKRVVTLSAATFAAKTLDVQLGTYIGYIYKGSDKQMSGSQNKIVYMTDGSLTMKIMNDPYLKEYKVIIIDEAHERKIQIDLLLLFLKRILLSGQNPDLKIIIMSATIDGEKYKAYFPNITSQIIHISGQPNHEIVTHFLDEPSKSYMMDGLNLIKYLINNGIKKDMLFFITSSNEALQLCKSIRPLFPKVYCIEVYADMSKDLKIYAETRDKFLELGNYDQKLVMATNVAESSLTIDGLKYVIDSGYELYSYFDPETAGQILEKRLISKAQALQRRGRVGRTEPGICYHLLTKKQFDSLADYAPPEILRQDITMEVLKIVNFTKDKSMEQGQIILNELMDVPKNNQLEYAYDLYKLYKLLDQNEILTKSGRNVVKFSSLPINRSLFLIYAYQLYCVKEATIIISMIEMLNGKLSNLFYKSDTICKSNCYKDSSKKLIKKLTVKNGDHMTFLKIFNEYKHIEDKELWARKYGIKVDYLRKVNEMANNYYRKIINISKDSQLSRIENINIDEKILEALKLSHQHLIAKNLQPIFTKRKQTGEIQKDSIISSIYTKKNMMNMTFIYDELICLNGTWEFSIVTIID